jgi:O-antigen/teichoic acid export membrane protein
LTFVVISGGLVPTLIDASLLPPRLFQGFAVFSIFSTVMTVDKSRYWVFSYLGGFVVGVCFALPLIQFIGPMGWLLHVGTAIAAVLLRVKIHRSSF